MSKKQMTLVYYYVPEDHDDQQTPNVFGVSVSKNTIRLQHIYDNFPLKGSYIFRFKVMYDNTIAWLDLPDLDTKLPTFKDRIIIKATRISWQSNRQNPYGHYRFIKREPGTLPVQQHTPKKETQPQPAAKVDKPAPKAETTDLLDSKHEQPILGGAGLGFGADLDLLGGPAQNSSNAPNGNLGEDFGGLGDLKNLI